MDALLQFFSTERFIPHGHCFLWEPSLLWSLVVSDAVIAVSYYAIPVTLLLFVKRRRSDSLNRMYLMFSAFIFACGTTHLIAIATIWVPNYWLDAGAKAVTAAISAMTAMLMWPLVRQATDYVDVQERTTASLAEDKVKLQASLNILKEQRSDLQALNEMSGLLHACNNLDEMGVTVTDTMSQLWPNTAGAVYLLQPEERTLVRLSSWGDTASAELLDATECWSFRLGRPFPEPGAASKLVCSASGCSVTHGRLCVPIVGGGETLAVMQICGLDSASEHRADTILPVLIERVGLAIYNLRLKTTLEFKSTRDGLTGLFNRRYFDESLQTEEHRAKRTGSTFAIVIIDLDHFKSLNDTHGHDTGDVALKRVARVLEAQLRSGDIAARYGGEEFVLILPGSTATDARHTAERVRVALKDSVDVRNEPGLEHLTASAGVAAYPEHGQSYEDVVRRADQALYRAKDGGRDRVEVA